MFHVGRKFFWIHFIIIISSLQGLKMRLLTFRESPKVWMNLLQAKMTLHQVFSMLLYSLLVDYKQVKRKFLLRRLSVALVVRMGMNVESLIQVTKEELKTVVQMEKFAFQRMDQQAKQKFAEEQLVDEQAFLVISQD